MGIKAKYAHLPPLPSDIVERPNGLAEILQRHPVGLVYLFGSSADLPEKSNDVDIVADHILANVYGRTVETYEGLLAELCSVSVISQSLYRQLKGVGGFRDVLVHEYLEVDLNEVADVLSKAPQVFRSFGAEVLSWLSRQQKEG